jgi:hypothetical protein
MTARKSSREIRFNGQSLEAMLSLLLRLKPELHRIILHLQSEQSGTDSAKHLYWLESEFQNLVSSAMQEVAAVYQGSTATPFDVWVYPRQRSSPLSTKDSCGGASISRKRFRDEDKPIDETTVSEGTVKRKRLKSGGRSFSITAPFGKMQIVVPCPNNVTQNASNRCSVSEVGFSFSPRPDMYSTSIHGRFMKILNCGLEPRLCAQLNAFNIVEDWLPHCSLIRHGTLEEIDTAFRVGKISPYDIDEHGDNVCFYVIIPLQSFTAT